MKQLFNKFLKKQEQELPKLLAAYRILPEEGFIVELYGGHLTMQNIINYKMTLINDPAYKTAYTMFGDIRACVFEALVENTDEYIAFIKQNNEFIMDKGKHVGIMSTYNQQIFIQLFKDRFDDDVQNQGMFTSIEEGLAWIDKKELQPKIESVLKELKKELKAFE